MNYFAYILKMCELFVIGNVIYIENDKTNKTISIILEDNVNSITSLNEFKEHINEFFPAFYEIIIKNNV